MAIYDVFRVLSIRGFVAEHEIGKKIYWICVVMALFYVITVLTNLANNPKQKLKFITKAQQNKCTEVAKMTCLTVHGNRKAEYYLAEYMYVVNGENYFITYQIHIDLPVDSRRDNMNADMLLRNLNPFIIVYYDQNKPQRAYSKLEVFASEAAVSKTSTPDDNAYRNVNKNWDEPIDMIDHSISIR